MRGRGPESNRVGADPTDVAGSSGALQRKNGEHKHVGPIGPLSNLRVRAMIHTLCDSGV
jgi:hypothetical protein